MKVESFMVTNLDGDPQDFADHRRGMGKLICRGDVGDARGRRSSSQRSAAAFRTTSSRHCTRSGYAGWPIWVASGRKPL